MRRIYRNLYHLFFGLLFPVGYYFGSKWVTVIFTSVLLLLMVVFEVNRFKKPGFNKWIFEHFSGFVKSKESKQLTGTTYFLSGALLTVIFFPKFIAVTSLTFMALGDVGAAIIGRKIGKIKVGDKSLEGTLTFFAIAFLSGLFLLHLEKIHPQLSLIMVTVGALTSAIIELLPLPLDDNFSVPLITGLVISFLP